MPVLLYKMSIILFKLFFQRKSIDDFGNFMNVLGFILVFSHWFLSIVARHWWYVRIFALKVWISDLCIDWSTFIYFTNFHLVWRHFESASKWNIFAEIPENISMEFGHTNNNVETIIEVPKYISWSLKFVAVCHTNKSFIEFLQRPCKKSLSALL